MKAISRPSTFFISTAILVVILVVPAKDLIRFDRPIFSMEGLYPATGLGLIGLWLASALIILGVWLDANLKLTSKNKASKVTVLLVGLAVIQTILHYICK